MKGASSSFDTIIVTSNGLTYKSPHCCYAGSGCEYNEATKNICANALCNAQGYTEGKFLASSNNFCNKSFTDDYIYAYELDTGNIEYDNYEYEASITAECTTGQI